MNFELMKETTEMLKSADVSELPTIKAMMFVRDCLVMTYGVTAQTATYAATVMDLYFGGTSVTEDEMEVIRDLLEAFVKIAMETTSLLVDDRSSSTFDDVLIEVMRKVKVEF